MNIKTKNGKPIDVTPWLEQIKKNIQLKRDPLERTPIGKTANKTYFWFDEKKNPALDTRSVNTLVKQMSVPKAH